MTDDELIARIESEPKYLIDMDGTVELIKRFNEKRNQIYALEAAADATE